MPVQPHLHEPHRPSGQLADWIQDVALLALFFAAAAILAAILLFMIII